MQFVGMDAKACTPAMTGTSPPPQTVYFVFRELSLFTRKFFLLRSQDFAQNGYQRLSLASWNHANSNLCPQKHQVEKNLNLR